jgi:uncharacterized protein involved in exopolysaccharide biosynthesis
MARPFTEVHMDRYSTFRDLLNALRRRARLALVVAVGLLLAGAAAILALPAEYRSQTVVQIEPHRVAPEYIPAASVTSFEERMRTVKHGLLARPVLERLLTATDFFPDLKDDREKALEKMRRAVEVRLEGEVPGGPPALLFVVEVKGRDRHKVAKAAELLPTFYAEMVQGVLRDQAKNLRETLDAEVAELQKRLGSEEGKLQGFKAQHGAELPESVEANLRAASRAQALIEVHLSALADARRRRSAALNGIPEHDSEAGRAGAFYDDAVRRYQAAQASYGPEHPEVKRLAAEVAATRSQRIESERTFRQVRVGSHLGRLDAEIREHQAEVKRLTAQMDGYQRRLEAAPRWGAALAGLGRDHEALRAKLAVAISRAVDARAAETLFLSGSDKLFRLIEPAAVPNRPAAPHRVRLLMLLALLSLVAGAATAVVVEYFARAPVTADRRLGVPQAA